MTYEQAEIDFLRRQMRTLNSPTLRGLHLLILRSGKGGQGDPDRIPVALRLMREVLASRVVGPKGKLP